MKIVEPQRDALRSEQILIAAFFARRNDPIKTCSVVQQIQGRRVPGINVERESAQAFEIRLPWRLPQAIGPRPALTLHLDTARFYETVRIQCKASLKRG